MKELQRILARIFGLALLFALLTEPAAAADKVLFVLDWLPYGKHAPLYLGIEKCVFQSAGIDLRIERGFGSSNTVKRIAAGEGDFGIADSGSIIEGQVRGIGDPRGGFR